MRSGRSPTSVSSSRVAICAGRDNPHKNRFKFVPKLYNRKREYMNNQASVVVEKFEMTDQEAAENRAKLEQAFLEMRAELDALKKEREKKNQRPGVASGTKSYELLLGTLPSKGLVPRQQADIATILVRNMEVGARYTEAEVFKFLVDDCGDFPSITGSRQDVTYLFRYYRGLSNKDGKHAGYVSRGFLRMV